MGRSAASIQAEIDRLETFLSGSGTTIQSVSADGTTTTQVSRKDAQERLDQLYQQLDRATGNAPMIVRGRVRGL